MSIDYLLDTHIIDFHIALEPILNIVEKDVCNNNKISGKGAKCVTLFAFFFGIL